MKKHYSMLGPLVIFVAALLALVPYAYADDASQFNQMIRDISAHRAHIESQLGIDPNSDNYPHATSYYDDLTAHYELEQIMSDFIDKGIR